MQLKGNKNNTNILQFFLDPVNTQRTIYNRITLEYLIITKDDPVTVLGMQIKEMNHSITQSLWIGEIADFSV